MNIFVPCFGSWTSIRDFSYTMVSIIRYDFHCKHHDKTKIIRTLTNAVRAHLSKHVYWQCFVYCTKNNFIEVLPVRQLMRWQRTMEIHWTLLCETPKVIVEWITLTTIDHVWIDWNKLIITFSMFSCAEYFNENIWFTTTVLCIDM